MTTNEENMSNALTTLTRTLATKLDMGAGLAPGMVTNSSAW